MGISSEDECLGSDCKIKGTIQFGNAMTNNDNNRYQQQAYGDLFHTLRTCDPNRIEAEGASPRRSLLGRSLPLNSRRNEGKV